MKDECFLFTQEEGRKQPHLSSIDCFRTHFGIMAACKIESIRFLWTLSLVVLSMTGLVAANPRISSKDCESYPYCDGIKFPNKVTLAARFVNCDQVPEPRERCCLPQAKHVVCYGITVDGQYLNYDGDNYARTTDFTSLCGAMARAFGYKTGIHSGAYITEGGGHLVWRYGEWAEVESGLKRVKNLACEIK